MSNSQLNQLIHMANQIAANNTHHDDDAEAAQMVASHLKRFWARAMKQQIISYADSDGSALSPVARQAVAELAANYSKQ